jgi:hypothetical protein
MNETTLNQGEATGDHPNWVRRAALGLFCLVLVLALGFVFTRAIAARVPEQRATLEKLITDRTGLDVRFENVRFAWDLKGTSAVFDRVELTDPRAGRVRVVAPELRVEFDTWNFLRHQQFSFGHVTLSSPDVEIYRDADESLARVAASRGVNPGKDAPAGAADEAALVRRYLGWAAQMPIGRVEVENARVHLVERYQDSTESSSKGRNRTRQSFTLSQAVVSRGTSIFSAYGTMLLAQDVGQSLFVSAKLEGLGPPGAPSAAMSGDLRVIARRVFLEALSSSGLRGRGTLDAKLEIRDGRVSAGTWQASARELLLTDSGARFDHVSFTGALDRDRRDSGEADLLLDIADVQITRGGRLERAPRLAARIALAPGTTRIASTRVDAERVPFMAAELLAGIFAPDFPAADSDWRPIAGQLRDLRFESDRREDRWTLTARLEGGDLARSSDRARLTQVAARIALDSRSLELRFDPAAMSLLRMDRDPEPRALAFDGAVAFDHGGDSAWRFDDFSASSDAMRVAVKGEWNAKAPKPAPLDIELAQVDRAWLGDVWTLLAAGDPLPELLATATAGKIESGSLKLLPLREVRDGEPGSGAPDWRRAAGKLALADLAGGEAPRLAGGRGTLDFARGGAVLRLDGGTVDDMQLRSARLDWPRDAAPRLRASLDGSLASPLLRETLVAQGLERLTGKVSFDADARGEKALRDPKAWRVVARVSEASVQLSGDLPAVERIAGTLRYSERQLRALELEGQWMGGPVDIVARRPNPRAALTFALDGVADASPLLRALRQDAAADVVSGKLAWSGTAQRLAGAADAWQIGLASNLSGVESRLPEPFDKSRAKSLPVTARLRVDAGGVREFSIDGRELSVDGTAQQGAIAARFEIQGIEGELTRAARSDPELRFARLDARRAPGVFAMASAMLPANGDVALDVADLRFGENSLGALRASFVRRDGGLRFVIESADGAPHQFSLDGGCAQGACRADFVADTTQLATLVRDERLPAEWPRDSLHAKGEIHWPHDRDAEFPRSLAGRFDFEAQGADGAHVVTADATLADGQILLANLQGAGPASDQVFRGSGRVGLLARDYDITVDYERLLLAATAVPTPARARLARAWSVLRGSAASRGWTEAPESRRVQWHGYWD